MEKKYLIKLVGTIYGENEDDAIDNFREFYYDLDGEFEIEEIEDTKEELK